jgi:hypothetical protein
VSDRPAPLVGSGSYFLKEGVDPDLLKIDMDGAEMCALRGMSRMLSDKRPDLLLEIHPALQVLQSLVSIFLYHRAANNWIGARISSSIPQQPGY